MRAGRRIRKNQSRHDRHRVPQWCSIRVAPATVSAGWLWEMHPAIVARVRDRNPMEVADDLGHRFWRLLLYARQYVRNVLGADGRNNGPCLLHPGKLARCGIQ